MLVEQLQHVLEIDAFAEQLVLHGLHAGAIVDGFRNGGLPGHQFGDLFDIGFRHLFSRERLFPVGQLVQQEAHIVCFFPVDGLVYAFTGFFGRLDQLVLRILGAFPCGIAATSGEEKDQGNGQCQQRFFYSHKRKQLKMVQKE